MANSNRTYSREILALERDVVNLYGVINVGASGAVSSGKGGGVVSVVKEATAGQYTVTLDKGFSKILHFSATVVGSAVTAVSQVQILMTPAALATAIAGTGAIVIQCLDFAGAAVNPASGAQLQLHVQYRRTSAKVGAWD